MKLLARVLVIGLMPFFLLITNTNIVFNHWFVNWQYAQANFPPAPTIRPDERQAVGLAALDFVRGNLPLSGFVALTVNDRTAFNEREVSHMVDVRNVLRGAFVAQAIMGVLILVSLFAFIVLRALFHAMRNDDPFTRFAVAGLAMMFGTQSAINMAVNLHLMPAKGMTLPFISYGGSSLISLAYGMGMLLALTRGRPRAEMLASDQRFAPALGAA